MGLLGVRAGVSPIRREGGSRTRERGYLGGEGVRARWLVDRFERYRYRRGGDWCHHVGVDGQ